MTSAATATGPRTTKRCCDGRRWQMAEATSVDRYGVPASLPWPGGGRVKFDAAIYYDRCVGSLVAGALGDGLGLPVESWSRERIVARYGQDGVTGLPPEGARWSDDTQLTAAVGESLVAMGGRFDPDDFVQRLIRWLPTGRGVGAATRKSIRLLERGRRWDEAGPEVDSSGNGAAMRTAPVGLLHALDVTPEDLLAAAPRGCRSSSLARSSAPGRIGLAGICRQLPVCRVSADGRRRSLDSRLRSGSARDIPARDGRRRFHPDCRGGSFSRRATVANLGPCYRAPAEVVVAAR